MNRTFSTPVSYLDAVASLPRKPSQEYAKRHTIYGPGQPCTQLYLVRSGRVMLTSSIEAGAPAVIRIIGPGGIFGEGLLIGVLNPMESAVVLDPVRVMAWSRTEVEQHVSRDPNLGLALVRHFVQRCAELNARVEALAFRKTPERVML